MDYLTIKLLHLVGLMLLFLGLGGMLFAAYAGYGEHRKTLRRTASICHGIGLFLLLISGIWMLSTLGFHGDPPNWVKAKFVIWLLMGGAIALAGRLSSYLTAIIVLLIALGAAAAYLGLMKPF